MKRDDCIFCRIAGGEIPSDTVYEDDLVRAILDLSPATTGHVLVIPKDHYEDALSADCEAVGPVFSRAVMIAKGVKRALGADGVNIVQNNGIAAGQTVPHLHVHIIPRYTGGENIVSWVQHESVPDEQAETARIIREALKDI